MLSIFLKNAFALVRTLVFFMILGFPLKFILNVMPSNFVFCILIIVVIFFQWCSALLGVVDGSLLRAHHIFSTWSRSCMRSEYFAQLCRRYCCCNNLFERKIQIMSFRSFLHHLQVDHKTKLATNFGHCRIVSCDRFEIRKVKQ